MSTTPTPPAESSPAPVNTTVLAPRDGEARAEWLKTGNMPEAKPNTEESAPSKEPSAEGQKPEEKGAPGSEPGKKQEPRAARSNADTRKQELNAEIEDLLQRRHQLRSEIEGMATGKKSDKPESRPDTPVAEAAPGLKAPVKPKAEDFAEKPWTEWEAANAEYFEKLADYKAAKAIEDFKTSQAKEKAEGEMRGKMTAATERYGAEAGKTIHATGKEIFTDDKVSPVVKNLLNDSPVFVDLLYAIGEKPEYMADFLETARTNPGAAIRKVVALEREVEAELAKGGKPEAAAEGEAPRGEDGKFRKAPEKKTNDAPPPPTELSGQRSAPPDEQEAAFKRGDARAFIEAERRKIIAANKGR